MKTPPWVTPALWALLVWSFALRVWVGLPEPRPSRFWDERYGLTNVYALLSQGEIRPANGFHPSLSYLPQAAVLGASEGLYRLTGQEAFRVVRGEWVTPLAYRVCRFLQAVFGTLSLYLVFLVGRRLFSPAAGFWAALLLSAVLWHVRQSAIYKPDVLLLLLGLWVFHLSLRAAEQPSLRRYLLAGAAIGLALATKFNAGPVALPLAVAAVWNGWRDRRQWLWLVAAGAVSVAVFLVLNPYVVLGPEIYQKDFSRTLRDYERKSIKQESSHAYVLWHGVLSLLSANFHGKLVGFLGLLGSFAFPAGLVGRGDPRRLGWSMATAYMLGYSLLYAASTTNASPHNWLPLTPFVALFAAAVLVEAWRRTLARREKTTVLIAVAVALFQVHRANAYAYGEVVPTTREVAQERMLDAFRVLARRYVYYEKGSERLLLQRGQVKAGARGVLRLDAFAPAVLDRTDAELFFAGRLEDAGAFYEARRARLPEESVEEIAAGWFNARGETLWLLLHPWRPRGRPMELAISSVDAEAARTRLPEELADGEAISLEIEAPRRMKVRPAVVGGESRRLLWAGRQSHRAYYLSERFVAVPGAEVRVVYEAEEKGSRPQNVRVRVQRWLPPKVSPSG